jgi:hypothetical protein
MAAGVDDTHRFDGDARTARIEQSPGVRDMQQVRISKGHHAARARRHQEDEEVLPLDWRDPDITRAKQLQMAARSRARTVRGESTT